MGGSYGKESACTAGDPGSIPGLGRSLEKGIATHSSILVYEAMRGKEERPYKVQHNAAQRTVELLLLLLDRQFPINYPQEKLEMRSATDYAQRLSIHVNHLNRVVKQVTGKTTTEIIASRITKEAIRLLQDTQLNVSEVAYALGFEEQASFTGFLKRRTGKSPKEIRIV